MVGQQTLPTKSNFHQVAFLCGLRVVSRHAPDDRRNVEANVATRRVKRPVGSGYLPKCLATSASSAQRLPNRGRSSSIDGAIGGAASSQDIIVARQSVAVASAMVKPARSSSHNNPHISTALGKARREECPVALSKVPLIVYKSTKKTFLSPKKRIYHRRLEKCDGRSVPSRFQKCR